jgi:hypothetical protein
VFLAKKKKFNMFLIENYQLLISQFFNNREYSLHLIKIYISFMAGFAFFFFTKASLPFHHKKKLNYKPFQLKLKPQLLVAVFQLMDLWFN